MSQDSKPGVAATSPRQSHVLGSFGADHDPYDEDVCNQFFANEPAPPDLAEAEAQLKAFVALHVGKPIVLVTSGGTTVPLEVNTVRFIDNFSAGTRGAISAEHFLDSGYAVIFLHRKFSLAPFTHNFLPTVYNFLDHIQADGDSENILGSFIAPFLFSASSAYFVILIVFYCFLFYVRRSERWFAQ